MSVLSRRVGWRMWLAAIFIFLTLEIDHVESAFAPNQCGTGTRRFPCLRSVPNSFDTFTSGLASICRLPFGVTVDRSKQDIEAVKLVTLFDIENNVNCREVRERITELDLNVASVVPATPNSRVFQDKEDPYRLDSGSAIPTLVAAVASETRTLVGKDEILTFFSEVYGPRSSTTDSEALERALTIFQKLGNYIAGVLRLGRGSSVTAAVRSDAPRPAKPLILYSYEGNQFCRLVREVLTELDLVYELRSAGKMSPRREELASIASGSTTQPFLIDPNTGTQLPESVDICDYLYKTYAKWTPPSELLQTAGVAMSYAQPLFRRLASLQAGSYKDDKAEYEIELAKAIEEVEKETVGGVVIYTYGLSPFSTETKTVLENLGVDYTEISLGLEWIPGLIAPGGSIKRAALLELTGQSSLPQIFFDGKSIGGLFTGTPGLIPALEQGMFSEITQKFSV